MPRSTFFFALLLNGPLLFAQHELDPMALRRLSAELDSIHAVDQNVREELIEAREKFGYGAKELEPYRKKCAMHDSTNQIRVSQILDENGFGIDQIGDSANTGPFIVVQHAKLPFQEKYKTMLRQAYADEKIEAEYFAVFEDRLAVDSGKKQKYGSQMGIDPETGNYFVRPIEDPDHVDERRAAPGMTSLADYAGIFRYTLELGAIQERPAAH